METEDATDQHIGIQIEDVMAEIHHKKLENIKGKILTLVENTILTLGRPSFESFHHEYFLKLSEELSKNSKFQFDAISMMIAYMDAVIYYYKFENKINEEQVSLKNLNPQDKDKVVKFISEYLLRIPFNYVICIPINHLELPSFSDGEKLKIEYKHIDTATPTFGSPKSSKNSTTELFIPTNGYYSIYEKEYFMKEVSLVLNVLIYSLRQNKIIKRTYNKALASVLDWSPTFEKRHQITIHTAKIKTETYPSQVDVYDFPITYAKYLSELEMEGSISDEDFRNKALKTIKETSVLLDNKSPEAVNIVSAIDWCIQSEINLDKTMAFIQTCMGLEALLGDNSNEGGLTLTLTDRCAYLIGKGMSERSEIKKQFKAIYQLRSKLVHGRINKISAHEMTLCAKASYYLRRAIEKELTHLSN